MRGPEGAPLRRVALHRRAAAWLAVAALLAISTGQPFHGGRSAGVLEAIGFTASGPSVDAASPPHGGAHLPGLCSLCRAIAQTRLGLRSPVISGAGAVDAVGLRAPLAAAPAPPRSAQLASIEPRAPPRDLPVQPS